VEPAVTFFADADRWIERLVLRLIAADPARPLLLPTCVDHRRTGAGG
jgi:hypothetical protein